MQVFREVANPSYSATHLDESWAVLLIFKNLSSCFDYNDLFFINNV